jgi:hypothetical protein
MMVASRPRHPEFAFPDVMALPGRHGYAMIWQKTRSKITIDYFDIFKNFSPP